MAAIRLEGVEKRFPGGHVAVRGVSLEVRDGEFLVLVGPSGCGKSTLLRLIAGLETPTAGRVLLAGEDVTERPPQERDVAMVFQSYALYPHMTVRDNLAYGLRVRAMARGEIARRVADVAEALGLQEMLDRRPAQLSGGQRQRVALGRAMVREPKALLLDEPLSNLDPALRAQARAELLLLHRRVSTTVVHVTHDQEEAMTLGQRLAVMREGAIEQCAEPLEVYRRPVNTFVAQFIGSPPMNLLPAPVPGVEASPGVVVGIRPQDLVVGEGGALRGTVELVEPRGHDALVRLRCEMPGQPIVLAVMPVHAAPAPGRVVGLACAREAVHLFDGRNGARL